PVGGRGDDVAARRVVGRECGGDRDAVRVGLDANGSTGGEAAAWTLRGCGEGDDRARDRVLFGVVDGDSEPDREAGPCRRRFAGGAARSDRGGSAGQVFQPVVERCGAAGGGGGGGEAAGGGVREQRWRAGSAAGVGQGGCLVAAAEEAGAGARARLGQ